MVKEEELIYPIKKIVDGHGYRGRTGTGVVVGRRGNFPVSPVDTHTHTLTHAELYYTDTQHYTTTQPSEAVLLRAADVAF